MSSSACVCGHKKSPFRVSLKGWKSCVGLKPTGGSNPLLCASFQAGFYPSFLCPKIGKEFVFCRFRPLELVHYVRIDVERHIGRRVAYKLLTYRYIYPAFRAPRNKRMPKLVQVVVRA